MPNTADYLNQLIDDRNDLADNLVTMGVAATHSETFTELVPKVLDISGGGNIFQETIPPTSDIGVDGNYYYFGAYGVRGYKGNFGNQSGTGQAGWEFYPNNNILITGLEGMTRINVNAYLVLADVNGNIIKQTESVNFTADAAKIINFDTPVTLMANTHYIVQIVASSSGSLRYAASYSPSLIDSNITYVQGRYGSLPGNTDTALYSVNIIIDDGIFRATEQYYKKNGVWTQIV